MKLAPPQHSLLICDFELDLEKCIFKFLDSVNIFSILIMINNTVIFIIFKLNTYLFSLTELLLSLEMTRLNDRH